MKKFLLVFLASLSMPLMLASCDGTTDSVKPDDNKTNQGDNSSNSDGNGTKPEDNSTSSNAIDFSKPETLQGTYDVTFFATKPTGLGALGTMSTNCNKAGELKILTPVTLGPDDSLDAAQGQCTPDGKYDAKIIGQQAIISYDPKNGLTLQTKLQLWHEIMSMSPNDTYQHTVYTTVPVKNITAAGINTDNKNAVIGVSGRHLIAKTSNPKSTFKITKLENGDLYVDLTLKDKKVDVLGSPMTIDAPTFVILKKKSNTPEKVDPNSLFKTTINIEAADKIFKTFKQTPDDITQ